MGKKKSKSKQSPQKEKEQQQEVEIEGKFLLGKPKFKKLENGRYKCVETGHELPADARESYAHTKHCRLGLINSALARNKPPLNMFHQDPLSRSRLICNLTGMTVNKTEEHIWKHINGKRFLNMLEKEEAGVGKEVSDDDLEIVESEPKPKKASKKKGVGLVEEEEGEQKPEKSSKKTKKNKKKKKTEETDVSKIISEVRDPEEKDSDTEEDEFWMPPVGDRWDFDDGKDRWGSDLENDDEMDSENEDEMDSENDDADEADDATGKESNNETQELSKRTKRMSIEIEPSEVASKKKKKKVQST